MRCESSAHHWGVEVRSGYLDYVFKVRNGFVRLLPGGSQFGFQGLEDSLLVDRIGSNRFGGLVLRAAFTLFGALQANWNFANVQFRFCAAMNAFCHVALTFLTIPG
jgi:hypothetical protein